MSDVAHLRKAEQEPAHVALVQKLTIASKLSSLEEMKYSKNEAYDVFPSITVENIEESSPEALASSQIRFNECVVSHRKKLALKSKSDRDMLTLVEEYARLQDQLSLFQLKCREVQTSIKRQKVDADERKLATDSHLDKIKEDTAKTRDSILSKVEIEEKKLNLKIQETVELKSKLEQFTNMVMKQKEHSAAVKHALSLHDQLAAAKTAQNDHILSTLEAEDKDRQNKLNEQKSKIDELRMLQTNYEEKGRTLEDALQQNVTYGALLAQKKELLDDRYRILNESNSDIKSKLKLAEAQIINLTVMPSQLRDSNAVKALKCKQLQAQLKELKAKNTIASPKPPVVTEEGTSSSGS